MFCGTCGNGYDYKTIKSLQRHEKAAAHKRRVDAQFAATEEADKRVTEKVRDEKQKAIKGGEKETARKANRDQREANARRNRSAAEKQADANWRQRKFHGKLAGMHKDVPDNCHRYRRGRFESLSSLPWFFRRRDASS